MKSRTTLKKISTNLNLSISTVSRALKNHPDISEDTKQKVKELASLLEYEPNTYAINLRTNSSKIFGLIVPKISNTFYDAVIEAAEQKAREFGFSLMILQSGNDPVMEAENLRLCKANRVAGVMISIVRVLFRNPLKSLKTQAFLSSSSTKFRIQTPIIKFAWQIRKQLSLLLTLSLTITRKAYWPYSGTASYLLRKKDGKHLRTHLNKNHHRQKFLPGIATTPVKRCRPCLSFAHQKASIMCLR